MNAIARKPDKNVDSISGMSAAFSFTKDDSLASLMLNHGIKVRDFILLSFLSDQGPMSILGLARVAGLEPEVASRCSKRLSAASLLVRDPAENGDELESVARLTWRGEDIAGRINEQLE